LEKIQDLLGDIEPSGSGGFFNQTCTTIIQTEILSLHVAPQRTENGGAS